MQAYREAGNGHCDHSWAADLGRVSVVAHETVHLCVSTKKAHQYEYPAFDASWLMISPEMCMASFIFAGKRMW